MKIIAWIAGAFVAASIAGHANGAITYLTQVRRVFAGGFVNGQPEEGPTFTALDFGVFNRETSWTFSQNRGTVRSSQLSRLLPDRIEVTELVELVPTGLPGLEARSQSTFNISFALSSPSSFIIQQSVDAVGMPGPVRSVRAQLSSATGGDVFSWTDNGLTSNWPATGLSGTLGAGQYSLLVECLIQTGGSGITPIRGGATLNVIIPTPASSVVLVLAGLADRTRRRARDAFVKAGV